MKKLVIIILSILFSTVCIFADEFEDKIIKARDLLEEGYLSWNEAKMQESLAQFERLLFLEKEKYLVHYYLGLNSYRLAVFYNKDEDKSDKMTDMAINHLEESQKLNNTFAESYALLSSCYGLKIGMSPWKGMILGIKSGNLLDKAVSLEPDNPRVWLMKGISTNYTPKIFGGSKEKALEELKKAESCYENEKRINPILPGWGYDETFAWMGIILKELGKLEQAKIILEKGLKINPENGWIKYQLLPQIEEALEKQ